MNILLTVDELAKYLKIKPDTIYKKVRKGELPAIKLGKLVRFQKEMIDQWLAEQASKTIEAVESKVDEAVKEVKKKAKFASKVMHDVPDMIDDVKKAPLNKKQDALKKGLKTLWKDISAEVGRPAIRARTVKKKRPQAAVSRKVSKK